MTTLTQPSEVQSSERTGPSAVAGLVSRMLQNDWVLAAWIFLVTRSVALIGAYMGVNQIIAQEPERSKGWLVELGLMWDAGWYVTTGQEGYNWYPHAEGGTNVAFPPLLPALLSAFSHLLRWLSFGWDWGNTQYGSWVAAGLLISNVSFFVALALLIKFLAPRLGRQGAGIVTLALASLPLSLFFSAIYTEALFLLLVVGAFLVSRSDWPNKWLAASALGLLAGLLKFAGVLLAPVLFVEYLSQCGWNLRKLRMDVLWLCLVPLGIPLYMAYLGLRFGNPMAFSDSEYKGWGHQSSWPWTTYWDDAFVLLWRSVTGAVKPENDWILLHGSGNRLFSFLDVLVPPLMLVGAFIARKKLLASEWAWLLLGILFPLSSGTSNSLARYMLPLWPGLIWLGTLDRFGKAGRALQILWILVSLALLMWCASIYGSARWIG